MALPIGLTSAGLIIPTADDIIADINEQVLANVSPTMDTSAVTPYGEFVEIFADVGAAICELVQAAYSGQDPDSAAGTALEQVSALTGTFRLPATSSRATLSLTGVPATLVPTGSQAANAPGTQFATTADATITLVSSWAASTGYTLGQRRTNSGRVYQVITAGTSAGSGGPTTTGADITDNTVHWRYLGDGTGVIDVASAAVATGPSEALSGTINEIVTPVSGWQGVINVLDADVGTDEETDEDLRTRRETDLANAGTSPVDAIRADLLRVPGVTNVIVFHNTTDATDVDGVPPHSVEALVQGGEDQDIWDQLLASVAGGIQTHGTEVGTATDASGNVLTFKFTRPTLIPIYIDVFVTKDPSLYPLDGDEQVKVAIVAYGDSLPVGRNVVASATGSRAFSVAGTLDVTLVELGTAPSPSSSTTIVIGSRELATYDTSRITVTSVNGTP